MKAVRLQNVSVLIQLREAMPFLMQLPDKLYFGLDPSEFYIPSGEVAEARSQLEKSLGHPVMTYEAPRKVRGIFSAQLHSKKLLRMARLRR